MASKVKPLADRVLVEAAAAEETTKGGIIIPDTAKEKPQRGKICLLYTSDAADERSSVDLGGRRIIKKKNNTQNA